MVELDPAARAFLAAPERFATIATIDPDGSPLLAVIWYRLEADGSMLINSLVGRRWPDNLLRDPRMSMLVEHGYEYVAVRGEVEVLHEGTPAVEDILALAAIYHTGEELEQKSAGFRRQARISFLFRPRTLLFHH
jgi:PPOX class probable F420-dependent enzyme